MLAHVMSELKELEPKSTAASVEYSAISPAGALRRHRDSDLCCESDCMQYKGQLATAQGFDAARRTE